MESTDFE